MRKFLRTVSVVGILLSVTLWIALFSLQGNNSPTYAVSADEAPTTHKVIIESGTLSGQVSGLELWHDYGAFALYRATDEALNVMPQKAGLVYEVADEMDWIYLDAYPINTKTDASLSDVPTDMRAAVTGSNLYLVQFVGPIKGEWLEAVKATGAEPIHYIANNAYLVWADTNSQAQLENMTTAKAFLQFTTPYHPYFKLDTKLRNALYNNDSSVADEASKTVQVTIQMVRHDNKQATEALVENMAVRIDSDWSSILEYQNAIVTVRRSDIATLLQQPDVYWIGERYERELMDEVQGQIVASNVSGGSPSGTGYMTWLNSYGFSTNPNDYPVVDIVDDGIGNGSVNSGDPTLHETGSTSNPTRLSYVSNCTSASNGAGPDGHGHINVSIAGGYDLRSGFPFRDPNGYQRGLGINPYGRFAGTRIFGPSFNLSNCGNTDTGLIKSIQDDGADIASNSWGCGGCAGSYDDSSQAFDVGSRDADLTQAGNQELIMIFSAGNSGPSAGTVGTPGNGKNMITVGASENVRPSDEDGSWTDGCNINASGANDWRDVISFSSRGPSPGNRVKPEVIAPGTHIQGTASTNGSYNGSSVCDQYRPSGQTTFAASSGTSHSAPAVAGVASLYYYWLENTYSLSTPSPAMLKAYLVAHPTYLTGVGANDTLPSNSQGYGMPDMTVGFDNTARILVDQSTVFGSSGQTWTWNGAVADASKPVRIVLAYTDAAGAIGTSPQVNNLNLAAKVDGSDYLGNVFSGQWSVTGGSADSANNYEAVFLPAGTSGNIELTVTAFNIGGDGVPNNGDTTDQDFALVCYNCELGGGPTPTPSNTPPPTNTPTPTNTPAPGSCTTYSSADTPIALPNGVSSISSNIVINGSGPIDDINVDVDMPHAWVGDLSFVLTHQDTGVSATIIDRPGVPSSTWGCSGDDILATLDDEAALPVENQCAGSAPTINGTFSPNEALSAFDNDTGNGTWVLQVLDAYTTGDAGTLNGWSIEVCIEGVSPTDTPAPPTATNTPAPPTATPTNTPIPPTSTPLPPTPTPTNTPVPGSGPNLQTGVVTNVGSSWTTVNLASSYASMVVVANPNYSSADLPAVVRIRNASGSSFEMRVENPSGTALSGYTVHYMVVEEGVYTVAQDGVKMEAAKYNSTVTAENNSWVGEARTYSNSYTSPVVLGQVMTSNDVWSVFWNYGSSRSNPPNGSTLFVGKNVAEDPNAVRANETVGYIVIEAGNGSIDGVNYTAALGADTVRGTTNSPPYNYTLSGLSTASVAVISQAAMDGGNGGWAYLYGSSPVSSTTLQLAIDEDQVNDSERNHTTEQVGYIVFE